MHNRLSSLQRMVRKRKYPVSGSENALLMTVVKKEWPEWFGMAKKQQIGIMNVQLTNFHDTVMSIWTKICEKCFLPPLESMPQ